MDATHFIADKFVRTRNMLEAIALGKPVVTHLWLDSCGQASCLLDEKNYILRDSKREKEIGFSMSVSLARARQYPLLKVISEVMICIWNQIVSLLVAINLCQTSHITGIPCMLISDISRQDKRVCVTQNIKPSKEMITSLVKAAGGEVCLSTFIGNLLLLCGV